MLKGLADTACRPNFFHVVNLRKIWTVFFQNHVHQSSCPVRMNRNLFGLYVPRLDFQIPVATLCSISGQIFTGGNICPG